MQPQDPGGRRLISLDPVRRAAMNEESRTPFDSIEDAHEFLTLLAQTVFESKLDIEADVQRESNVNSSRRADALKLTLYELEKLEFHMLRSRRILNDLRTLRRLLFEERTRAAVAQRAGANGKSNGARKAVIPNSPSATEIPVASA